MLLYVIHIENPTKLPSFCSQLQQDSMSINSTIEKDAFLWNEEAMQAFRHLKEAMTSLPMLALPDFSKAFVIETDACGVGLGAVLMQEEKSLAYFNHKLSSQAQAQAMSVYEREFMAMVLAIRKWWPYLL